MNGYEAFLAMVASGQRVSLLLKMPGAVEGLTIRPLKEAGEDLIFVARAVWRNDSTSPLTGQFIAALLAHQGVPR